jgi:hypothetical protein
MKRAFVLICIDDPQIPAESITDESAKSISNTANTQFRGKNGSIRIFDAREIKNISIDESGHIRMIHRTTAERNTIDTMLDKLYKKIKSLVIVEEFTKSIPKEWIYILRILKFINEEHDDDTKMLIKNILLFIHDYPTAFNIAYMKSNFSKQINEFTFRIILRNNYKI